MYVKIENLVGIQQDGYIFECNVFSWERIDNSKGGEQLESDAVVGDYGIYNKPQDIRLALLVDDTTILLESGDVYVMNEQGKTVDSIHV